MRLPRVPLKFLVHEIEYMEYLGNDDWQKPIHADPVKIENVRVDSSPDFSVSSSGEQILYNALIFCYKGLTTPLPNFKVKSRIKFNGVEHTIVRVVPVFEAYVDDLYSIELEVV